jgi:hypothetical protein
MNLKQGFDTHQGDNMEWIYGWHPPMARIELPGNIISCWEGTTPILLLLG